MGDFHTYGKACRFGAAGTDDDEQGQYLPELFPDWVPRMATVGEGGPDLHLKVEQLEWQNAQLREALSALTARLETLESKSTAEHKAGAILAERLTEELYDLVDRVNRRVDTYEQRTHGLSLSRPNKARG